MDDVEEILAEEPESPSYHEILSGFFQLYGWYLLILGFILLYIYSKMLPYLEKLKQKREDNEYSAKYHKDPDAARSRLLAQEAYARRLQEEYNLAAEEHKRKMEEKESKKREEFLAKYEDPNGGGKKLGTLKTDYNPLMGDSSRGYRAQKKSPCGGGGCGK